MMVCKAVTTSIEAMHDLDALVIGVDIFNICHNKLSTSNHLANRVRNCRDVEIARCNFMKHWRKEDKVVRLTSWSIASSGERSFSSSRATSTPANPPPRINIFCLRFISASFLTRFLLAERRSSGFVPLRVRNQFCCHYDVIMS